MKRVLYLTNIETPYRVRFFNALAKHCDLTVLYETKGSEARDKKWAKSVALAHRACYLRRRSPFFSGILRWIRGDYDHIIVGCFNDPVQMVAILAMRLLRIPYIINLDGETFLEGSSIKQRCKRFFLRGAKAYLVAGECACASMEKIAGGKPIIPYYFSSLSEEELERNAHSTAQRNDTILVVGQYFDYKGMDVALEAACADQTLRYKFVGMGGRTERFLQDFAGKIPPNVEVVPFLQKQELEEEYRNCDMLLLPSRQECWGLVITEAASFGMPIVSTWGSGAAVEFLSQQYPQYLAKPGDAQNLLRCIHACMAGDQQVYTAFLLEKSKDYSIERSVLQHIICFE